MQLRDLIVEGLTYQLNSPIGLDLKLLKRTPKEAPKDPLEWSLSVLVLGKPLHHCTGAIRNRV